MMNSDWNLSNNTAAAIINGLATSRHGVRPEEATYWARVAVQRDAKRRSRYAALHQRGCSHGRAIRSVADRLVNIACVLLTRQRSFDPAYGEAVTV
jgi:hypothetical protein